MLLDKLRNKQTQRREKGCIPAGCTLLSFDSYQELGTRNNQEDCLLCLGDTEGNKGFLGIVADGMGGMEYGEVAARMVADCGAMAYEDMEQEEKGDRILRDIALSANEAVNTFAEEKNVDGVGSTMVGVYIKDGRMDYISVGDSRIYMIRDGELKLLTHEHTYDVKLKRLVSAGVISDEDYEAATGKSALTSYIGIEELKEIDSTDELVELKEGDSIILMSDGVFNTLDEEQIMEYGAERPDIAAELIRSGVLAEERETQDNHTAIVIRVEEIHHTDEE